MSIEIDIGDLIVFDGRKSSNPNLYEVGYVLSVDMKNHLIHVNWIGIKPRPGFDRWTFDELHNALAIGSEYKIIKRKKC